MNRSKPRAFFKDITAEPQRTMDRERPAAVVELAAEISETFDDLAANGNADVVPELLRWCRNARSPAVPVLSGFMAVMLPDRLFGFREDDRLALVSPSVELEDVTGPLEIRTIYEATDEFDESITFIVDLTVDGDPLPFAVTYSCIFDAPMMADLVARPEDWLEELRPEPGLRVEEVDGMAGIGRLAHLADVDSRTIGPPDHERLPRFWR